jgi:predicted DNA-binding transcriptional regulator YafY
MTTTASEQLRRILNLIPRLADESEHRLDDLATTSGISRDELMSVFSSLSERFDAPGGFVEGVSIFVENESVTVHANHFHRPIRLTMPELCALELGLAMLRRERTPAEQEPIDMALDRLRSAISQLPSNERHEGLRYAELAAAGSAEHLAVLRDAQRSKRKAVIRYRSGGASESRDRVICPHAIVFSEQMWYLVALCEDDVARFFRLDRMEDVRLLDESFTPDASVLKRVMEEGKAFASDATRRMTVRYSPAIARWIGEREGKALAEDGSITLEHQVADEAWAVRHVLQYGPEAEIIAPADLRAAIAERLDALRLLNLGD